MPKIASSHFLTISFHMTRTFLFKTMDMDVGHLWTSTITKRAECEIQCSIIIQFWIAKKSFKNTGFQCLEDHSISRHLDPKHYKRCKWTRFDPCIILSHMLSVCLYACMLSHKMYWVFCCSSKSAPFSIEVCVFNTMYTIFMLCHIFSLFSKMPIFFPRWIEKHTGI